MFDLVKVCFKSTKKQHENGSSCEMCEVSCTLMINAKILYSFLYYIVPM